jgi:hypothetical protein
VTPLAAVVGAAFLHVWMAAAVAPSEASSPANASGERAGASATAVEIAVVGSDADLARVRALVRPKAAAGAIRWQRLDSFRPPQILDAAVDPVARSAATRCWIDLSDARRAHLYFVGRSGARFLIRDVELSGRFDELDLTSLAEVIDLSLAAVLDDERAGISRAEAEHLLAPPPSPPVPRVAPLAIAVAAPPAARAPAGWSRNIRAGAFYAAQTFAAALPLVSGPGLVISGPVIADDGGRWQLGVWLAGQYQIAGDATGDLASVRLATIAARAGMCALRFLGDPRSARWAIEVRAGAGADTIHLTPEPGTRDGSAALTPARWSTSLALTAAAGVATMFGGDRFRLGARLYADVLPIATHYDLAVDGQPAPVVAPYQVRPGLVVDLTVALGAAR